MYIYRFKEELIYFLIKHSVQFKFRALCVKKSLTRMRTQSRSMRMWPRSMRK